MRIEISGGGVTVLVDQPEEAKTGERVTPDAIYWIWLSARTNVAQVPGGTAPRFEAGAAGFVIEQADEWRNAKLPGGDTS